MKSFIIGAVAVLMSCSFVSGAPSTGSGNSKGIEKPKEYQLPKDPKAVVISLNFKGGYGPRRKSNSPTLSILANGTVLMPNNYGLSKDIKTEMSKLELQELLRFIIEENQFLKYDNAKVAAAKKKALQPKPGGMVSRLRVADAATTVIYLHAEGKEVEASEYALSMYAGGAFKEVKELQQLLAIQKRLQQVMKIATGGGIENVMKILKEANVHLKKKYPQAKPFTIKDFQSARVKADGSKYYSFNWFKRGPKGNSKANTYAHVRFQIPVKGDPKITVSAKLK
ncbi:hypothetical protein MNBD_PLANCTO02-1319 [hydrothermal vent metagenome]|uniref:Lipoprotein n=1 Tax=hydrothermal vent metagenome TaxID=652676 RepID=A0A3B1E4J0_9ZZZZ